LNHKQLLTRIRTAATIAELDNLLLEGRGFENATRRTISRWKIHARRRRKELEENGK